MIDSGKGEELCLALLLRYPELRPQGLTLTDDYFVTIPNRQLFQAWRETAEGDTLRSILPEELHSHLEQIAGKDLAQYAAQAERVLADCIRRIEQRKLREAKIASTHALEEVEEQRGAVRVASSSYKVVSQGSRLEDLPEDETLQASIAVHDMKTGREMHEGPREDRPKED